MRGGDAGKRWRSCNKHPGGERTGRDIIICIQQQHFRIIMLHSLHAWQKSYADEKQKHFQVLMPSQSKHAIF